jgi:hypothetical protein
MEATEMNGEIKFQLVRDVSSDDPSVLRLAFETFVSGTVTPTRNGFHVEGVARGKTARDVNRGLLSTLRRVERRTRCAECTQGG